MPCIVRFEYELIQGRLAFKDPSLAAEFEAGLRKTLLDQFHMKPNTRTTRIAIKEAAKQYLMECGMLEVVPIASMPVLASATEAHPAVLDCSAIELKFYDPVDAPREPVVEFLEYTDEPEEDE